MALQRYLADSTARSGDHAAVVEPEGASITYAELSELTDRLRDRLAALGVEPGDRVGLLLHKSIDSVAGVFGILKRGAAYVPVDASAPVARAAFILDDCQVKAVLVEAALAPSLGEELAALGSAGIPLLVLDEVGGGKGLSKALDRAEAEAPAATVETHDSAESELAYIIYTSGSTGRPKGVPLTHGNAEAFVDWCTEVFSPTPEDRFSSHAPFHFDLSILDLYTPIKHGATLVLIGEELGKEPGRLAEAISSCGITIWYSAPSILTMLVQFGKLESHDYSKLRSVLFAGEVFPIRHLRALIELWPHPSFYNLYGPTETNVCTYHPVPSPLPADGLEALPIGAVCSHLSALVIDEDGTPVSKGESGELCIAGPNVMEGYWNLEEQTRKAFVESEGVRFYRTGDLVVEEEGGVFTFMGRRDRMIKRRGYRVELGEIEACLYRHPDIHEAAVVAVSDDEGVKVHAHYASQGEAKLSMIKLKKFCSEHLPVYMIPDTFKKHEALPKTSTDKTDYQALKSL